MEPRAARPATPAAQFAVDGTRVSAHPAPLSSSGAAPAIVALSEDPTLLEALTLAAIEQAAVVTSPSADRFVDQLVANGADVALIDAACAPSPLEDFVASLHGQFPQLLLLIAGPPPLQHQLAAQMADGAVFRFVHKPASAQRLKLFVDAALSRRQALGEPAPADPGRSAAAPGRPPAAGGRRRRPLRTIALLLTLGALGALALFRHPLHVGSPARPAPVRSEPAAATARAGSATAGAEQAERDRLLAESRQREAALLEQVRRTASGARAEQAHVYADLARRRLAGGALLQPSDDSARTYVQAAVALAPDDTDVRAVARALGEALIAAFRHAIADGDEAAAEGLLQACRDYHINAATQAQLASQLEALQNAPGAQSDQNPGLQRTSSQQLEQEQPPAAAPAAAAPTAPAAAIVTSPTSPAAATAVVPESDLQRVRFVAPVYPPDALARGVTGSVDLEFTVTSNGEVRDIRVQSAEPPGVFEQAAISALSRSRYVPVERDGVTVAQRARVKIRFTL